MHLFQPHAPRATVKIFAIVNAAAPNVSTAHRISQSPTVPTTNRVCSAAVHSCLCSSNPWIYIRSWPSVPRLGETIVLMQEPRKTSNAMPTTLNEFGRFHSQKLADSRVDGRLCDSGGGSNGLDGGNRGRGNGGAALAVDLELGAVARDVASLATAVAGLAGGVEGSAVGSGAVAGDVAKLAAGVALHGLSLAVAGEVVGTAALVASRGAAALASEASAETSSEAATGGRSTSSTAHSWVGAVARQVARQTAAVAASAGASTAQAEGGAVSLNVSKTLAVVALLSLGGAGMGASVGLVAGLLAVVAKSLRRGAHLGIVSNVSALEARTTRERRHDVAFFRLFCFCSFFDSFTVKLPIRPSATQLQQPPKISGNAW